MPAKTCKNCGEPVLWLQGSIFSAGKAWHTDCEEARTVDYVGRAAELHQAVMDGAGRAWALIEETNQVPEVAENPKLNGLLLDLYFGLHDAGKAAWRNPEPAPTSGRRQAG